MTVDEAIVALEIQVEPELWVRGTRVPPGQIVDVGGMTFDLRPYRLVLKSFPTQKDRRDAIAELRRLVEVEGMSIEKAWRITMSTGEEFR